LVLWQPIAAPLRSLGLYKMLSGRLAATAVAARLSTRLLSASATLSAKYVIAPPDPSPGLHKTWMRDPGKTAASMAVQLKNVCADTGADDAINVHAPITAPANTKWCRNIPMI
jgi:hypothetical protein